MIDYKRAYTELMDEWFEEVTASMANAAWNNRGDIEVSGECGCFACGRVFDAARVGVDGKDRESMRCPTCGERALVPDFLGGYKVSDDFLGAYVEYRSSLPKWKIDCVEERIEKTRSTPAFFCKARYWANGELGREGGEEPDYEACDLLHCGRHVVLCPDEETGASKLHVGLFCDDADGWEFAYGIDGLDSFADEIEEGIERIVGTSKGEVHECWGLTVFWI